MNFFFLNKIKLWFLRNCLQCWGNNYCTSLSPANMIIIIFLILWLFCVFFYFCFIQCVCVTRHAYLIIKKLTHDLSATQHLRRQVMSRGLYYCWSAHTQRPLHFLTITKTMRVCYSCGLWSVSLIASTISRTFSFLLSQCTILRYHLFMK